MLVLQKNRRVLSVNTSGRKVYVHCNGNIVSFTHQEEDGQGMLYCVSAEGDVLKIGEYQILQRSSDTGGDTEETVEIFEDLLRTEDDEDDTVDLKLSTEPVTVLSDKDVLGVSHAIDKTIGICIGAGFWIIHKSSNALEVYRNALCSFDISNPMILHLPSQVSPSRMYQDEDGMIVKILTCDNLDSDVSYQPDVIRISVPLFRTLFGADMMLINSSVVLVCPCDGTRSVIYTTLPATTYKGGNDFLSNLENENACKWNTLCQMSSRIVAITAITLEGGVNSTASCDRSALGICSQDGHVTVFHCDHANTECMVSELYICSPVLTMCSFRNRLYHSTGNQLFESTCMLHQGKVDQQSYGRLTVQSKALNETSITKLYVSTVDGYTNSLDSPCNLHCVLLSKDVRTITVPLKENTKTSALVERQENIRHILKSMDSISQQKECLMKQTGIQKQFIQQLNIASFLINFYLKSNSICEPNEFAKCTDAGNKTRVCPFQLNFVVKRDTSLSEKDFRVECELTNQMTVNVSHDWLISISMYSVGGDGDCRTVSRKLKSDWKHGQKFSLFIPITLRQCLAGCKLIVKATLLGDVFASNFLKFHYQARTKSSNSDNCSISKFEETLCISIPVFEEELDVIHCLLPEAKYTDHVWEVRSILPRCYLTELARNRLSSLESLTKDESPTTVCTRSVIQLPGNTDLSKQEALCNLLGKHIVEETDIDNGGCHLRTLDGQSVYLNFNRVDNQASGPCVDVKKPKQCSGYDGVWEVTVRSTPEIAAAVHKALNRRECILMKHGGIREEKVYVSEAHKALANVKDLISQLQDCMHGSRSDGYKNISLVYEKLRNIYL